MEKNLDLFREHQDIERPELLSPLALAFVGDAVYEVFARILVTKMKLNPKTLHRMTSKIVSARGQKIAYELISKVLTEEEEHIFKRGRNQKPHTVPKNTDVNIYRIATGFEALVGYLYLKREDERLFELFEIIRREYEG